MKRHPELLERVAVEDGPGPRQVYADWWLEQAEPRGEYVALMLALARRLNPVERRRFLERTQALFQAHRAAWEAELTALGARELRWRVGFVEALTIDASALERHLGQLLTLEPIAHLEVSVDQPAALVSALRAPPFGRIRRLRLSGAVDALSGLLGDALYTDSLESLALSGCTATGLRALARCPAFEAVQRLTLSGSRVGDLGLTELAASPLRLAELFASRLHATDRGVGALLRSEAASRLETLALNGNTLGPGTTAALAGSAHLGRLRSLDLSDTDLPADAVEALLEPGVLPGLEKLVLEGQWYQPALRARLAARFPRGA